MLVDQEARALATDPHLSCIVQAPAGSGKTEILTQRFLRLLSQVTKPEQIVALTFTRKAANEMRERVMRALEMAARGEKPASTHQQVTYQYATDALLNDAKHDWKLLSIPSCLRITTIDSLCQTLAQAMPLQEKQTPYANVTDHPDELYLKAARACLAHALIDETYQPALDILFTHFDNRQDKVLKLLSEQLKIREQWLRPIYQARLQDRAHFEEALRLIETHEIERFKMSIPTELVATLIELSRELANIDPNSPRGALQHWYSLDELNRAHVQSLASLLLTSQLSLRKAFDHHVGLKRDACDALQYKKIKTESKELLAELNEHPTFIEALLRVRTLPPPLYPDLQWNALQALLTLLPLLAGHLQLIFNESNEVDFSAIAATAHFALRKEDGPTDLALYLDSAIHHLLIDEFQDTSLQQFELMSHLVEGFEPNDGKTLFVVGDPMQSIYRFRGAEVGLFLRAKTAGMGPVKLTPLQLQCNFRSNASIVHWINQRFKAIFPCKNDIESGAITFHKAAPIHEADQHSHVQALQYASKAEEAEGIALLIQQTLKTYPNEHIALLVRARSRLTHIIHALRQHHIPYQGVDIDWLAALPHVRDVWSLTQALLMPANRLAWLALLRSPWCGLTLKDMHHIANIDKKKSIYHALALEETYLQLTHEGRARAHFLYTTLNHAITHRHQQNLSDWILNTLKQLHLDAILTTHELDDLEQYWLLIEKHEKDGQLINTTQFKDALNGLYSKRTTQASLQIMTIHKAKGLEFDSVILPSLGSKTSNTDKPLLRWLTLPTTTKEPLVLVSPLQASREDNCPLYDYLSKLDHEKERYEQQRLFYVATTRTKKRLYLTDYHSSISQNTFRGLLHDEPFQTMDSVLLETEVQDGKPELKHLPHAFYAEPLSIIPTPASTHSLTMLNDGFARILGIAAHELLQWICTYHPKTQHDIPWEIAHYTLKHKGLTQDAINAAFIRLKEYIHPLFDTPRGQWIISPHVDEKNEYEFLIKQGSEIHTRIIDRTFYDNEIRWIIDFKTGRETSIEEQKHRAQVNDYAMHLTSITPTPIHCGLYYLNTHHWVEWEYCATNTCLEI